MIFRASVNEETFIVGDEGNWLLHVDGSPALAGNGAWVVLTSPKGNELEYALRFDFKTSNNEAEYEALIAGIRMALDAGARNLIAYSDSLLVTKKVKGEYEVKKEKMKEYLQEIVYGSKAIIPAEAELETLKIQHYEQENNNNLLRASLDLTDEVREDARTRLERYKQRIVSAYNQPDRIPKVHKLSFILTALLAHALLKTPC
ncbi:UNVERIFIED_CONTAM: hypothetical protein Sradi_4422200 [Sesamum radiatum]|uniref:RNase H type-1 domain-containing protein n=1 Tax=Sesamum radiatum TaxID=300843 RepID=A0AAW2NTJ3_SESRA